HAMGRSGRAFSNVLDRDIFTPERDAALLRAIETHERIIVTTAVAGAPVERRFLDALLNYAHRMDATIVVIPANMQTFGLDPLLLETPEVHILTHTTKLTPELRIDNIKLVAKHIWPLQGLDRLGPRRESFIVGSPKMHAETMGVLD